MSEPNDDQLEMALDMLKLVDGAHLTARRGRLLLEEARKEFYRIEDHVKW